MNIVIGRKECTEIEKEYVFVETGNRIVAKFYGPDAEKYAEIFFNALEYTKRGDDIRAAASQ